MPVPTTVADLDPVAANNYPIGSENVGPNLDNYLRAHASIIRQVSDGIAPAIAATVPAGVILMWSGSAASIPAGWKLCDGTNGTPNLVNRFVLGANATSPAVGATGGAATVTLTSAQMPVHSHSGTTDTHGGHQHTGTTNGSGAHQHTYNGGETNIAASGPSLVGGHTQTGAFFSTNAVGDHSHSFTSNSGGSHNHVLSVNNSGGDGAHENMPPYYALCFIQKS